MPAAQGEGGVLLISGLTPPVTSSSVPWTVFASQGNGSLAFPFLSNEVRRADL